jgi:hypothetical protein
MVMPKPDYDSGWLPYISGPIPTTPDIVLHHNLGTTDLLVSLLFQEYRMLPTPQVNEKVPGKEYWILTSNDFRITQVTHFYPYGPNYRVRLWKISP